MAHNREELYERINKLPLFEKRKVQVKDDTSEEGDNYTTQLHQAVCEVGKSEALAFVYTNYKLVQFKDIFKPILDSIEGDLKGYIGHDNRGFAFLKVYPEDPNLDDDRAKFGIMAINSVNLSSSIMVKFVVQQKRENLHFTIPAKIAGLKKQHTGKVENIVKDYVAMTGKVKAAWFNIVENFPKYKIYIDADKAPDDEQVLEFGTVISKLKIGNRLAKKLKKEYQAHLDNGKKYTLWDLFIKVVSETADRNFKSDAHRERRIEALSNAVFQYAIALSI